MCNIPIAMTDSCGSEFRALIRCGEVKCAICPELAPLLEGRGGCAVLQMFAACPHLCTNLDQPKAWGSCVQSLDGSIHFLVFLNCAYLLSLLSCSAISLVKKILKQTLPRSFTWLALAHSLHPILKPNPSNCCLCSSLPPFYAAKGCLGIQGFIVSLPCLFPITS